MTETSTLSNDRAINPHTAHGVLRKALLDRQVQPYTGRFQEICGGPDSHCDKRARKPRLNQLILRPQEGAEPNNTLYFSTFVGIGNANSASSVKWDFGHLGTPYIKFQVTVHNDHTQNFEHEMKQKLPKVCKEASITFVPGRVDMEGKVGLARCFKDSELYYSSPEDLEKADGKYINEFNEAIKSFTGMDVDEGGESSKDKAPRQVLAIPSAMREAVQLKTLEFKRKLDLKAQEQALMDQIEAQVAATNVEGKGKEKADATEDPKGERKANDRPPKLPAHDLSPMHELLFDCQAVIAEGLDDSEILRVVRHPKDYPEETVRNVKFMRKLVKHLQNFPAAHVPLAYYWQHPGIEIRRDKSQIFYDQAISPFLHAVRNDLPWFYHYHDATGNLDLDKIPDPLNVGGGMLGRGKTQDGLSVDVAKHQPIAKFNSVLDFRTVRGVIDQRIHTTPESKWEAFVNHKVTCHVVRMNSAFPAEGSQAKDVEMTDANTGDEQDDSPRHREYFKVYVSRNARVRKALGGDAVVQQGQMFTINFYSKKLASVPDHHRWVGSCFLLGTAEKPFMVDNFQFDFFLLAYRPKDSQVVPAFDSIEESLKKGRWGTKASLHAKPDDKRLLYAKLANAKLGAPQNRRFARILAGCVSENYPASEDPSTYPQVMPKASHDGKKPIARTTDEIRAYDKFLHEFNILNANPKWRLDKSQRAAVLLGTAQNLVNIVQGPPRTGKTKTLSAAAIVHAKVLKEKVIICAPSNSAVDGLALMVHDMLPLSFEGHVLCEHGVGAEQEFAQLSDAEEKAFVPKTKEDAEMLAIEQIESMNADDINTSDSTEYALAEMQKLHPKHFCARSMSTAACVHTFAIKKREIYGNGRDVSTLSPEEKEILDASDTLLDIGAAFNAMPGGQAKQQAAKKFNEAMKLLRIEAYNNCPIVITTCGNSANKVLAEHFKPTVCFVDEAAKATETDVIIPNVAFPTVRQHYLYGDDSQLSCIVPSGLTNEFTHSTRTSTLERLRECGISVYRLTI